MHDERNVVQVVGVGEVLVVVIARVLAEWTDQRRARSGDPTVELKQVVDDRAHDLRVEVRRVLARDERLLVARPEGGRRGLFSTEATGASPCRGSGPP